MADHSLPQIINREEARAAGLNRFFTGKKCRKGHLAERRVSSGHCMVCLNKNKMVSHHRHKTETNTRRRSKHAANPERIRELDRSRHAVNPERKREADRRRYLRDKKKRRQLALKWRAENPERNKELARVGTKRWRVKHPEKAREGWHKRRARERNARGSFSAADLREIRKLQRNRCARCRKSLKHKKAHVDHIIPLAKGGTNDRTNIQLLCAPCNLTKAARDPIDDARRLGRLL